MRSTVSWTVRADFLVRALILTSECGAQQQILAGADGNACQDAVASAVLDPGVYLVFVSPQLFGGVSCSQQWRGTLTAVPTSDNGACCFQGCPRCRILPADLCADQGGVFFGGAGSTCATVDCDPCAGDLNRDLRVDGRDLSILLATFNRGPVGDLNCDGLTDGRDLSIFLARFGTICSPR